jgi:hypothetical protein
MASSESRIAQRHRFETRFGIRLERDGRKLAFEGWARDISESGLGGFVGQTLAVGESVTLEIPIPGRSKLSLPAKVARCLGTQYGFRFTALTADQRFAIQNAVRVRR